MRQYLVRRLILVIPALIMVSVIVFSLMRLVPGDIVTLMADTRGSAFGVDYGEIRHRLGLDEPIIVQYGKWAWQMLHGDFGASLWNKRSATTEFAYRFPVTFELALLTITLACAWGIGVGVFAAVRQGTVSDYIMRSLSLIGLSVPYFWSSIIVITFGSIWFGWSPNPFYVRFTEDIRANLLQMLPPAILMAFYLGAPIARMTRATMMEVMRLDHVRTARAKGLKEKLVINRHVLKNAFIPVMGLIGLQAAFAVGGSTILETIWGLPGMGKFMVDVVVNRDYTMLQALNMFMAFFIIVINLLVDVSYAWLDPRIRYR